MTNVPASKRRCGRTASVAKVMKLGMAPPSPRPVRKRAANRAIGPPATGGPQGAATRHQQRTDQRPFSTEAIRCDRDAGRGDDGMTTAERQDLARLRRENRQLKLEREILSKAAAWFANEKPATPKRSSDS